MRDGVQVLVILDVVIDIDLDGFDIGVLVRVFG